MPFSRTIESEPLPGHTGPTFPAERTGGNSQRRGSRADKPATPRQFETLALIARAVSEDGYPPSLRELADALGVQWQAARDRVEGLVRRGLLTRVSTHSRTLVLTKSGRRELARVQGAPTPGKFLSVWRCCACGTARIGPGQCPECAREAGAK